MNIIINSATMNRTTGTRDVPPFLVHIRAKEFISRSGFCSFILFTFFSAYSTYFSLNFSPTTTFTTMVIILNI